MSAIKNLRALTRREASADDMSEFGKQVKNESNDRGATLLMATNLDLALTAAINQVVYRNDSFSERLDSDGGPLSSFSQRILMDRALRIFGEESHHNFDIIRHVRNAFAHAHVPITFETPEVKAVVQLLKPMAALPPHTVTKDNLSTSRGMFNEVCATLTHNIIVWTWHGRAKINASKTVLPPDTHAYVQKNPLP